jgi:hypothetical protein
LRHHLGFVSLTSFPCTPFLAHGPQLSALGATGRKNLLAFINRAEPPSAYVGFCAGGYIAAHDYLWETLYEGPGYYNFADSPPLSVFPHTVEGSLTDVVDDQFGDQATGANYRLVSTMCTRTCMEGARALFESWSIFLFLF